MVLYRNIFNSFTTDALLKGISNNFFLLFNNCLPNLDMSKAFDSVDHQILLHKMQNVRTLTSTLKWFNSYLTNVYQVV